MARLGGKRRKTRHKLKKKIRDRGKVTISRHMQEFKEGDRVNLVTEPAVQKGQFDPKFHGKSGVVKAKKGSCYIVTINDKGKQKELIVHPVHMK